ncbi:MAG: 16S rRNA (cytidine(1402)-2'-O)-methyltransferase [Hyphomicrobiales bacterium]
MTADDTIPRHMPHCVMGHMAPPSPLAPGLYITATPIGNMGDITLRALTTLKSADCVICEDTRVTRKLLSHYGILTPLLSYREHNAARVRPAILSRLDSGEAIALVTDAGTPLISDPGYKLIRSARQAGIPLWAVPGASAVTAALSISGIPGNHFLFAGFPPARGMARRNTLQQLMVMQTSIVLYEAPHRLTNLLGLLANIAPERTVTVARELTKSHEELMSGSAESLYEQFAARSTVKGEFVLVIAPPVPHEPDGCHDKDVDDILLQAFERLSVGKAAAEVAQALGLSRREVYARALALKNRQGQETDGQ